ncbi:RidA family protein [Microvirga splendida]|uniref:RidA family protein n=1 Tax=Microvirga splendida TaxID=2795727 RepID=A0ABS0Y2S5_9HYPH|nr:RidA family protein [Microvirga splendida]MBJ6126608.1 RidA family protein [Microvirga splendida]
MTRRLLSSGSSMEKAYGYSRAVVQGPWVFMAGTTGYDYETQQIPGDVVQQTRNCWKTIEHYLKEAGSSLEEIVRVTYYATDLEDAEAILGVCGEVLRDIRPASTFLVVKSLVLPEMRIEIEVTALKASA